MDGETRYFVDGEPFATHYQDLVQKSPEVAVEDGRFVAALRQIAG